MSWTLVVVFVVGVSIGAIFGVVLAGLARASKGPPSAGADGDPARIGSPDRPDGAAADAEPDARRCPNCGFPVEG